MSVEAREAYAANMIELGDFIVDQQAERDLEAEWGAYEADHTLALFAGSTWNQLQARRLGVSIEQVMDALFFGVANDTIANARWVE